ncbi:HAMP domain-containing sensor histidine kinase [Amycolatopsis samaneae]|uniref:histidine kinase n=1 Tax=Amycolatopsis samaneae TaxID=664691 RepID=A0ABW5G6H6_9PSEU
MKRPPLPTWLAGLRPRLAAAFALVTILGAAAASGATYVTSRTTILGGVQNPAMDTLVERVKANMVLLATPPTQSSLDTFASALDGAVVVYGQMRSSTGTSLSQIPPELRTAVAGADSVQFQRVVDDGIPRFAFGLPLLTRTADGRTTHSGVEVYATVSLYQQQAAIDELAKSAWQTTLLALPFAIALALLAARQVLRPVRALNTAASQLGHGQLDVRLKAKGSDELAQLVTTFNNTAAELERTVGTLREMEADARRFVADVSHELRTPLAAMNAVTDVLDEDAGQLPADTAVAARLVSAETKRLTRLVQDLVEISRFDAGRAELRLEEWDLATAVTDCLAARGWRVGEGLAVDLPEGRTAIFDRRRFDIVVANLVGNALRHGAPPVEVRVRTGEDTVDGAGREVVVLTVEDHGPGIPEETLPRVFDRFTKADTSRARSEGSGLGLAIARENARLHGGDLTASNTPDGARFTFSLPRYPAAGARP